MLTAFIIIRTFLLWVTRRISPDSACARRLELLLEQDYAQRNRWKEHLEKAKKADQMVDLLSEATKRRFSRKLRWVLLYSGWAEGRRVEAEWIDKLLEQGLPAEVADTLREFAGLDIVDGDYNRFVELFSIKSDALEWEKRSNTLERKALLEKLVGRDMFLIGYTIMYCDDGDSLYVDSIGNIYVEGSTGNAGEHDLAHHAASLDQFLEATKGEGREKPIPRLSSWTYHFPGRE